MSDSSPKVCGIGGVFLRVRDVAAMSAWYAEQLGMNIQNGFVEFTGHSPEQPGKEGARTVWSLFPADSDYFGSATQACMVNYRVDDLTGLLARLRQNGVSILKEETYDYGRFAWIQDPEGNKIELWEPAKQ